MVTLTLSNPSVFGMMVSLHPIEDESDTDYCSANVSDFCGSIFFKLIFAGRRWKRHFVTSMFNLD